MPNLHLDTKRKFLVHKAFPTKWINRNEVLKRTGLKISNKSELLINGKTHVQSMTFINDAAKIWNEAPSNIEDSKSLITAQKVH